jgi:hypothetical protein
MFLSILLGLVLLVAIVGVAYVLQHPKILAVQPPGVVTANLFADLKAEFAAQVDRIPEIVSMEVAQLKAALADMEKRALMAEADLAAERQAVEMRLAAVKDQVGSVIAKIGAQPAASVGIVAAQDADAARISAFADGLTPAPPAPSA